MKGNFMRLRSVNLLDFFVPLIILFVLISPTFAADKLIFDSTDHYLGACSLTNKSEWTLKEPIEVTTFEIWYSWNQGETELPVEVLKDGRPFADFTATRGNCDPYQRQWCNADYKINKLFPAGTYTTEIPNKRQCLKPGGTGAIRLYVDDAVQVADTKEEEPVLLEAPVAETTPVVTTEPEKQLDKTEKNVTSGNQTTGSQVAQCSCNTSQIAMTAAGTSLLVSLIVGFLLKRI
jgi:hypothetical protein